MTHYDFDTVIERRGTDCVKWNDYEDDVLPVWVADMDFVSPEPVIRALHERVSHGVFGYARPQSELRQVVVDRLLDLYNWQVQPEDLLFVPGVVTGFNQACIALANADQAVLVQTPIYHPILHAAQNTHIQHQEMQLDQNPDGSYSVNWDAFQAAMTDQTRVFLLCNPHNPIGKVFKQDELEKAAEICLSRGVTIVSDEIHAELLYRGQQHIPIASLDPEIAQNTITLIAPSKTFNIAGLSCSVAVIQDPELREKYKQAHRGLVSGVNVLGLTAALAAYRDGQEWLDQLLVYLEDNRDFVFDFVQQNLPGICMAKPEGTYLAWLDCRSAGIEETPADFFLREARVALNDGAMFGRGGEGFVRLNFGCPRSLLQGVLERMQAALKQL